jgi:hypothetical protein
MIETRADGIFPVGRITVLDNIRRSQYGVTTPTTTGNFGRSVQAELQPGAPVSGGMQSYGALVA